jgi:chromosome segregation ATPase
MESAGTLIAGIDYKIRKLISRVEALENENRQLIDKIEALNTNIKSLELDMEGQKDRIKVLKLAKSLDKEESRTEVKLKINELLREIDNCVRLLNK